MHVVWPWIAFGGAVAQTVDQTGNIPVIVSESSGVGVSRAFPGILWTHNDSGHPPDLFAITFAGQLVAHFQLPGAEMVDWEDLALAPCPATLSQNQTCIYIADTGDNFQHRRKVQLYVLPEPNPWNHRTGDTDPYHTAWRGESLIDSERTAHRALSQALVAEV